jgi:hypothetical protein
VDRGGGQKRKEKGEKRKVGRLLFGSEDKEQREKRTMKEERWAILSPVLTFFTFHFSLV